MSRRLRIGIAVAAALWVVALLLAWWRTSPAPTAAARGDVEAPIAAPKAAAHARPPRSVPVAPPPPQGSSEEDAADWLASQPNVVECHLSVPLESGAQAVVSAGTDEPLSGTVMGDRLFVLWVKSPVPRARLLIQGFAPVTFSIDPEHGCDPDPLVLQTQDAGISGRVSGTMGRRTWVTGCGGQTETDADGSFWLPATPGDCTLVAEREDGQFAATSDPVTVHVGDDGDTVVDIALPERETAGIGIQIRPTDDGIVIDNLIDGGAAADAGLEPGDVVTAIDGEATAGMTLRDFQDRGLGDAGSDVTLDVRRGDEDLRYTITRKAVP